MEKELVSVIEHDGNIMRVYKSDEGVPPNDILKLIVELKIKELTEKMSENQTDKGER